MRLVPEKGILISMKTLVEEKKLFILISCMIGISLDLFHFSLKCKHFKINDILCNKNNKRLYAFDVAYNLLLYLLHKIYVY